MHEDFDPYFEDHNINSQQRIPPDDCPHDAEIYFGIGVQEGRTTNTGGWRCTKCNLLVQKITNEEPKFYNDW